MSERSGLPVEVLTAGGEGNGYVQNPFVFKGGTQDRATGWVQFGNRFYDPTIGRWTQQDRLDAPLDPANANRYAFAGCDPINSSDPTGRWSDCERQAWVIFAVAVLWYASMVNPLSFVAASVNFFSVLMIESKGSAHFRCTA